MTITAGDLDRKITIRREIVETNALNEQIPTGEFATVATVPAMRRDVSDGEKFAAGQIGASLRSRFTVRSSSTTRTVTPADRFVHDGATWSIHGVKEANEGRNRFIEITAVKDAD